MARKHILMASCLALTAALALPAAAQKAPAGKEWPTATGDWSNSRFSTLKQINTTNVKQLGGAWVFEFPNQKSRATPVIVNGMMYVTAADVLYALNPKTGQKIWEVKLPAATAGMYKGVGYADGTVYVGLGNAHVVAYDAKSGKLLFDQNVGDGIRGQFVTAGPTVAGGQLITGMSNGDYGIVGRVVGLDAKTGKQNWRFDTVPQNKEEGFESWPQDNDEYKKGGGGVWVNPTVDLELGLAYFGVGNPLPQWAGETRKGDNLYTDSVVALDIKTGRVRWYFQTVHHDLWEADIGTPLVMYEAEKDGKPVKAIGAMRTDGWLFLLDRATGKPVLPVEEKPVPQNPRLHTSATQPFPVNADQLVPNCAPPDMYPAGFKSICFFDPIDYDMPNVMYPLLGARSAPMAYSPDTKYFYVTGAVAPFWVKRVEDPHYFMTPAQVPGQKSYGVIAAFDSRTNKIAWKKKTPYRLEMGSGMTATAGGLVFHGEPDGLVQAFDAKNGDVLWEFQTGSNGADGTALYDVAGSVASYEADGEQYVTLVSGGAVWAFKLGGKVPALPRAAPRSTETTWVGRIFTGDTVSTGVMIPDTGLEKIREAYDEYAMKPQRIRIKAGSELTFTNTGKIAHAPTAQDGSWSAGELKPGQSKKVKFDKPGQYTYIDKLNPWSFGQVIVE